MSFELHLPVSSFLGLPCAKLAQCLVMHRQVHLKKFVTVTQERINRCLNVSLLFSFGGPTVFILVVCVFEFKLHTDLSLKL